MKYSQFLMFGFVSAMAIGCGEQGSGVYDERDLQLDNFAAIEVTGCDVDRVVMRHCDCPPHAKITGDDNLIGYVQVKQNGGAVEVVMDEWVDPELELRVELYGPGVHDVRISGEGNVEVHDVYGQRFEARISGEGRIAVSGEVDHADIKISGDGEVEAYRLRTGVADIDVSGDGHIEICVVNYLESDVSGDGLVEYACDPTIVESDVSGDGSVKARGG